MQQQQQPNFPMSPLPPYQATGYEYAESQAAMSQGYGSPFGDPNAGAQQFPSEPKPAPAQAAKPSPEQIEMRRKQQLIDFYTYWDRPLKCLASRSPHDGQYN